MATAEATRNAQRHLLNFFAFEPGEARPTLLLTLYLLLAMASVITMKAISNSLFLTRFSPRQLPYVYVAIAAVAGFVVSYYIRLSARLPQNRLVIYTQMFLAGNLVLFWWLLQLKLSWLPGLIYVWTGIYAVIVTSQVWTLANHIFTTRQARRLFAIVGSGGILGAALGGLFSNRMARVVGTQNLLLACAVFLCGCAVIVTYLWRTARAPASTSARSKQPVLASFGESVRTIWGSRYLRLITILLVLSAIVNTLVDFQFKYIVRHAISDRDDLTAFFAGFTSYMALFAFVMQLVLTSRVMRWFGLNFAIFVLPLSMLLGSTILLFSVTLFAGTLLKGFDQAFRHSIDRSSTELLYVPLSTQVKQQAKSFIDMVVSRWADGLSGVLLFLLATVLHLTVQRISWVSVAIIAPWLGLAWMVRREYVNTLRSSIERKDISAEALLVEMAGASSSEEITTVLSSSDERAVETGLGLLQYGHSSVASAHLGALLTHLSPTIRRKALSIVSAKDVPGCSPQVSVFLFLEREIEPLWQALDYLERHDPNETHVRLKDLLEAPHAILRGTVAARLLTRPDSPQRAQAAEVFTSFVESARGDQSSNRRAAAELLGRVPGDLECQGVLADFLADPDPEVVRAALLGAGRARQERLIPRLIELCGDRRFGPQARQALAAFGVEVLPALQQALVNPQLPVRIRRNLPRVFSSIGGQEAANALLSGLEQADLELQYRVLRSLTRIRLKTPEVRFDSGRVTPLILAEFRRYYRYASLLKGVGQNGTYQGALFLRRALAEQLDRKLEVIFRLMGLLYPAKDIFDAFYGISSGRRDLRSNALEFLDSMLLNPIRQMLLPILEGGASERILEHARSMFGFETRNHEDALRSLLTEADPWLQSCAVYAVADQGLWELAPLIEPLANTENPLLQETVQAVRQRLPSSRQGRYGNLNYPG